MNRRRIQLEPIVKPRTSDMLDSGFVLMIALVALILAIFLAVMRWSEYLGVVRTACL